MCCAYLVESCLFWVTLSIKEVTGKCCLKVMDFRLTFETFTISSDKASSVQNTKKSHIQETMILSTCADNKTDTKKDKNKQKARKQTIFFLMSCVTCYVSCVMCRISSVTCYLSPVTNANSQSHSHRPFPC